MKIFGPEGKKFYWCTRSRELSKWAIKISSNKYREGEFSKFRECSSAKDNKFHIFHSAPRINCGCESRLSPDSAERVKF